MTPPEGSPKKTTSPKKKKVIASAASAADDSVKVAPSAAREDAKPVSTTKKAAVRKTVAKKAVVKKAVAKKAAAKKAASPSADRSTVTRVVAQKDAGFGNKLYIRGEGPGLSWEQGVEMNNLKADEWGWTTRSAKKPVEFKILLNDVMWMQGENATVKAGGETFLEPEF